MSGFVSTLVESDWHQRRVPSMVSKVPEIEMLVCADEGQGWKELSKMQSPGVCREWSGT